MLIKSEPTKKLTLVENKFTEEGHPATPDPSTSAFALTLGPMYGSLSNCPDASWGRGGAESALSFGFGLLQNLISEPD